MIDQLQITNYDRTIAELEEFILHCCGAAGHDALATARSLVKLSEALEATSPSEDGPASLLVAIRRYLGESPPAYHLTRHRAFQIMLQQCGFGAWTSRAKTFQQLAYAGLDLRTCSAETLMGFYGIGRKTAHFFILHSRPGERIACLDRHVLRWLGSRGHPGLPVDAPQSPGRYKAIQTIFLAECDKMGRTPADVDQEIFSTNSNWGKAAQKGLV